VTTYYRDGDVWITSAGVRMAGRDFRPAELRQVWHRRGPRSWAAIAGRGALGLAILVPILLGVLGVAVALLIDASVTVTLVLIGGGLLVGLAAAPLADVLLERVDRSYDRGSRQLEIWARTPAGEVLLLRTADAARFGRIYRALQRALEPAAPAKLRE
jgi:NhaP-type Na+/H+ or K+/H+ antiporter